MINNDESTQILNESNSAPQGQQKKEKETSKTGKKESMSKTAFAAGGFVAGVASTVGSTAFAASKDNSDLQVQPDAEESDANLENSEVAASNSQTAENSDTSSLPNESVDFANSPNEQDSIIATSEGIRVGQVSDDKSFAEAFADARAQVGPGGVFEWHGNIYTTYYKEEWEQMSAEDRSEFQAKVDRDDIIDADDQDEYLAHNNHQEAETSSAETQEHVQTTAPQASEGSDEIRVIGVEEVMTDEGQTMTVAAVGNNNDGILLIDVDQDGQFDAGWHDDNGDGQMQENEFFDASDCPASVDDLMQAQAQQDGNYMASSDNLPDYTNDADVSSLV